jgi:putative phosphoribosyl transferase
MNATLSEEMVDIPIGSAVIHGDLRVPPRPIGLVIFSHGSGSSRFSGRNRKVAESLQIRGFATLLLDLLTDEEESVDIYTQQYRFDIPRLGSRVTAAVEWATRNPTLSALPIGLFGASTGAAAAVIAAAARPQLIRAVVSRGGRPDLAAEALTNVEAPTLLLVGSADHPVIEMNRKALRRIHAESELRIVAGAGHLFEEPGTLEEVERLAGDWFEEFLD